MVTSRRYFLLDEPCAGSEIERMMCRVVVDKLLPLFKFAPVEPIPSIGEPLSEPSHNTNDIISRILPQPSRTCNRREFVSAIQDASIRAGVSTVLGIDMAMKEEERVELETKEVKRYSLSNPEEYFNTLMKHELYARDVRKLLKDTSFGRAYLVVGFLTTSGALWTFNGTKRSKASATATAPVTGIFGAPPLPGLNLDPTVGFKVADSGDARKALLSPDEEIFAVAYAVVKIRYGIDRHGLKRSEVVGPPKRGKANHLVFSNDDDDDDDDEEDDQQQESASNVGFGMADKPRDIFLEPAQTAVAVVDTERSFEFTEE